jgi:hypothetical protein
MNLRVIRHWGGAILAGGLVLSAPAQDKSMLPDAQVEANVLRALAGAPELSTQNIQSSMMRRCVPRPKTLQRAPRV